MMYEKFSKKQLMAMFWWQMTKYRNFDAIICDGSVRSGKTISMIIGFVLWSCKNFNGQTFAICGKTIDSLKRNVITPMQNWLAGIAAIKMNLSRNFCDITLENHTNRYYFFGGKDESSYTLIQGITLAGVFCDEAALMPRSFVEQALARCSVSGSKFWLNCNPESPSHWLYEEWIDETSDRYKGKNRLHLHFTMDDNLSLSENIKNRYNSLYSGVFYDRYIRGLWVVAEGLVYTQWDKKFVIDDFILTGNYLWYISMDYGTVNPCSMGLWCITENKAVRVAEYYYDSRKTGHSRTDEEHYAELEKLAGNRDIQALVIDPSAASFIECVRRHGRFNVRKADNDVINGINRTGTLIQAGKINVCRCCRDFLREIGLYKWDSDSKKDYIIKENDHAMDDMRYLVNTILKFGLLRSVGGDDDDSVF